MLGNVIYQIFFRKISNNFLFKVLASWIFFSFSSSYSLKLKENKMFSSQNLGGQKPLLLVMLVNYRLKNKIKRQLWTRGNTGWKNKNLNKKILMNN